MNRRRAFAQIMFGFFCVLFAVNEPLWAASFPASLSVPSAREALECDASLGGNQRSPEVVEIVQGLNRLGQGGLPAPIRENVLWKAMPRDTHAVSIFNPFGGADVFTPVLIAPNATRIVSAQLLPFGDVLAGVLYFPFRDREWLLDAIALQTHGMLDSSRLTRVHQIAGGLGLLALGEIKFLLHAEILDIAYLRWDAVQGVWCEFPLGGKLDSIPDHGRIRFLHEGKIIDYYLIRADLADPSSAEAFAKNTEIYREQKDGARVKGVSVAALRGLFARSPDLTVLKAMHQASETLHVSFRDLVSFVSESGTLYVDGTLKHRSNLGDFEAVYEYRNSYGLFGVSKLTIMMKRRKNW